MSEKELENVMTGFMHHKFDVLIANPNPVEAPVTMTFLREGGATVVIEDRLPPRRTLTVQPPCNSQTQSRGCARNDSDLPIEFSSHRFTTC